MALDPASEREGSCLLCGYDLRGLVGDPRRCPECGGWTPLRADVVSARAIRWRCAGLTFLAILSSALTLFVALCIPVYFFNRPATEPLLILSLAAIAWSGSIFAFRYLARGVDGWLLTLIAVHSCIPISAIGAVTVVVTTSSAEKDLGSVASALVGIGVGGGIFGCLIMALKGCGLGDLARHAATHVWAERSRGQVGRAS